MKIKATDHCLQRMKQRFIRACEIAETLNKGKVVKKFFDPEFDNQVAVVDHVIRGCTLRVVVANTGVVLSAVYKTPTGCHTEHGFAQ